MPPQWHISIAVSAAVPKTESTGSIPVCATLFLEYVMDERILMARNLVGNRLACASVVIDKMEYNAKKAIEKENIDEAKEILLDGGAEITSYLGEILQKIDEMYEKK